jgi:hypothetical protein
MLKVPWACFMKSIKMKVKFYKQATFYSVKEVIYHMENAQFKDFTFRQTLIQPSEEIKNIEPVKGRI